VAGAVRRHLLTVGRAAARHMSGRASEAGTLPCGHPADQEHVRFHPVSLGARGLIRT
jgi:hypothetical protein